VVLVASEKLTAAPSPESATDWTVGPDGAVKASDIGEGTIARTPPMPNETGMVKVAKPAAVTVMLAEYMPGKLSN
jgi:hypothetical protein